jgi:hypothetical protein
VRPAPSDFPRADVAQAPRRPAAQCDNDAHPSNAADDAGSADGRQTSDSARCVPC